MSFKNSSSEAPYLLQIINCEKACEYTKFISILSNYTLSNWDDECNIISFGDLTYSTPLLVAGNDFLNYLILKVAQNLNDVKFENLISFQNIW